MKAISIWGSRNPWASRILIIISHLCLGFCATVIGVLQAQMQIEVPLAVVIIAAVGFLVLSVICPTKTWSTFLCRYSYWKSRAIHFLILITGLLMVMTTMNQDEVVETRSTRHLPVIPCVYKTTSEEGLNTALKKLRKKTRKEARKTLKTIYRDQNIFGAIMLSILLLAGMAALCYLVAALACHLACSGAVSLAYTVLIGGWLGVIWLGYIGFRSIWVRKRSKKDRKSGAAHITGPDN